MTLPTMKAWLRSKTLDLISWYLFRNEPKKCVFLIANHFQIMGKHHGVFIDRSDTEEFGVKLILPSDVHANFVGFTLNSCRNAFYINQPEKELGK